VTEENKSQRQIASVLGVAHTTVQRDVESGTNVPKKPKGQHKSGTNVPLTRTWIPWMEANLEFGERQARRYMRCYYKRNEIGLGSPISIEDAARVSAKPSE
jgi:hypothetical protein